MHDAYFPSFHYGTAKFFPLDNFFKFLMDFTDSGIKFDMEVIGAH